MFHHMKGKKIILGILTCGIISVLCSCSDTDSASIDVTDDPSITNITVAPGNNPNADVKVYKKVIYED